MGMLLPTLPRYVEDKLAGDGLCGGDRRRCLRSVGGPGATLGRAARRPLWAPRAARAAAGAGGGAHDHHLHGGRRSGRARRAAARHRARRGGRVRGRRHRHPGPGAPPTARGEAASYFSVALYSGLALGPALGEHLADSSGYDHVWLVAGVAEPGGGAARAGDAPRPRPGGRPAHVAPAPGCPGPGPRAHVRA